MFRFICILEEMLPRGELKRIARTRLEEARLLFRAGKYDGAAYLCGYSVELGLKARICTTLKWEGFPESSKEFQQYASFRTHDLEILLSLSGREGRIGNLFPNDWLGVTSWRPEMRYGRIGTSSQANVELMIASAAKILKAL